MVCYRIKLIALLAIVGCTHQPASTSEPITAKVQGVWAFADSIEKKVTIGPLQNGGMLITFPYRLHAPGSGSVDVQYRYTGCDTIYCTDNSIYPDCFFYINNGSIQGMMQEDAERPGKGQYKKIVKL